MAEENKEGLLDQAKELIGDKAGEFLSGDNAELKEKVTEMIQKITPDSLDDKVPGVVDSAVDFITETFGKKD